MFRCSFTPTAVPLNRSKIVSRCRMDYLGGATETYDRRRKDVANAVFNIIMADHIEKKLPTNLLASRGGYALGILRLSCTHMTQTCNKCTAEFLFGTSKADEQTEAPFRHIYGSDVMTKC